MDGNVVSDWDGGYLQVRHYSEALSLVHGTEVCTPTLLSLYTLPGYELRRMSPGLPPALDTFSELFLTRPSLETLNRYHQTREDLSFGIETIAIGSGLCPAAVGG